MSKENWMVWQKQVIKEDYKDISIMRDKAQKLFDNAYKQSLSKVKIK
jgi:tRNA G46 methylase TrmB